MTFDLAYAHTCWTVLEHEECRKHLVTAGLAQVISPHGKFSISKPYKCLRGDLEQVSWKRLLCHNKAASPKSVFIL